MYIQKIIFLFLYLLVVITSKAQTSIPQETYGLKELLELDFEALKTQISSDDLESIALDTFVNLFFEGINSGVQFLDSFNQFKQANKYQRRIGKTFKSLNPLCLEHPIMPSDKNFKLRISLNKGSNNGHELFSFFASKWFGQWGSKRVEHCWLASAKPVKMQPFSTNRVIVEAYQTAYIGDGFGWNYQIHKNGRSFIIGFVCHFDVDGNIYLKRPHIGIPQSDYAIIWLTKDHIYFEYICREIVHQRLPRHYIISGAYFQLEKRAAKILKVFQEIYSCDIGFGLNLFPISHQ